MYKVAAVGGAAMPPFCHTPATLYYILYKLLVTHRRLHHRRWRGGGAFGYASLVQ